MLSWEGSAIAAFVPPAERRPPLHAFRTPASGRRGFLKGAAGALAVPAAAALVAADVCTRDNAWTLLESLRIDAGVLGPFGIHP
ncbi:hypothetical protein ACFY6U_28885 [Streptomyces sp. NPDC013157]|uniref:hypothetical protein n=1 Tax=Streptomyces sp. NPDC013157 TaxID=3364861 RepID=UPI0036CCE36B